MSPLQILVVLAAGALAVWVLGGVVCRVGGSVSVIGGAVGLMSEPGGAAVEILALGCAIWLVGHWHYAIRHGAYKSRLAGRILSRPGHPDGSVEAEEVTSR